MFRNLFEPSELVNLESLKEAIESNMRPNMKEINLNAFQMGYDYLEK